MKWALKKEHMVVEEERRAHAKVAGSCLMHEEMIAAPVARAWPADEEKGFG